MKEKRFDYRGESLVVHYDLARCIHAAECVRGLPSVFAPRRKPWVDPDAASAEEIVEVVSRCPTGALGCSSVEGEIPQADPPETANIVVAASGPLYLRGTIELLDEAGAETALCDTRMALCRCGESKNKPLCDGRHAEADFSDSGVWRGEAVEAAASRSNTATLAVQPAPDGPVIVRGEFEVHDAEGTLCFQGDKAALCRCGASENKPFCDGSHKKIEFRSSAAQ